MKREAKGDALPREPEKKELRTALGAYMEQTGITVHGFAVALGVSDRDIVKWRSGEHLPALVMAYEIERVTRGVVPLESWLGLPQAVRERDRMRSKQPEGVRLNKNDLVTDG